MLDGHYNEWLNLLVRWFHIIAGIAWIGASFYFNWLENNLVRTGKQKEGISGYLWAIHGGGIYRLEKYKSAPKVMPETLHWFKWEAYTTWLTGMALLFVQYYMNANIYLIDPQVMALESWQAVAIGIMVIIATWLVYNTLCEMLANNPQLLVAVGFILMSLAAYGLAQVFSGRGAFIHIGAMIGTMMVGNVAHVIMPSQRALLAAVEKGEDVDPKYGARALLRSRHNNYLTLPILFIMISNHYPSTFSDTHNWAILLGLVVISMAIRHHFNIQHKPEKSAWILPVGVVALLSLAFITKPAAYVAPVNANVAVEQSVDAAFALNNKAKVIIEQRCASCHAATPTSNMFTAAPLGILLESQDQIDSLSERIFQRSVVLKTMPLANITQMTDEERDVIGQWYTANQK
ncbi:hypothetical protein A9Q77_04095 [Marinomonas sp. 42_23_T18]|nr:hypothetical protein A9Q77_04095 [Marinomonas sp. 42_23_T18]